MGEVGHVVIVDVVVIVLVIDWAVVGRDLLRGGRAGGVRGGVAIGALIGAGGNKTEVTGGGELGVGTGDATGDVSSDDNERSLLLSVFQ
jgi:hypothetical protein